MNNRTRLLVKRILKNKLRFILTVINVSLGLFMIFLFATIGFNIFSYTQSQINSTDYYKQIYVMSKSEDDVLSNDDIELLSNIEGVSAMQVEYENPYYLQTVDGNDVLSNGYGVCMVSRERDVIAGNDRLLAGKSIENSNEALISGLLAEKLNLTAEDVLGGEVRILSETGESILLNIVGVYDKKSDSFGLYELITFTNSDSYNVSAVKISFNSVDAAKKATDTINEAEFNQANYMFDITRQEVYSILIMTFVGCIGLMLFAACGYMLKTSLQISIKDNMTFIALMKVEGYDNHKATAIVRVETAMIFALATVVGMALYIASLYVLPAIIDFSAIFEIDGASICSFNVYAVLSAYLFAIAIGCFILVKPLRIVGKTDVINVLKLNI